MAPELLLQRRPPGHELKSHPIFDHGEAAGGERDAEVIGAYDWSRLPDEQLRIVYDGMKTASVDGLGDVDA